MNELKKYNEIIFENIKHIDEYWLARELQTVLDYKKWQKFINVIDNAKIACGQSEFIVDVLPTWVKHQKCLIADFKIY